MVVIGIADNGRPPLLAVGEVKWGEVMGIGHLERLERVRALLSRQERYDTTATRLLCFGAAGFASDLRAAADAGRVTLIGLDQIYA